MVAGMRCNGGLDGMVSGKSWEVYCWCGRERNDKKTNE